MGRREWYTLFNDYLSVTGIQTFSTSRFFKSKIEPLLHCIQPFETPDMYAVKGSEVLILECFRFDGSEYRKHKGLRGISEEIRIENDIKDFYSSSRAQKSFGESPEYNNTISNYLENFKRYFYSHYEKLNIYIRNLSDIDVITKRSIVYSGFFIENKYPPIYINKDTVLDELLLIATMQFLDIFEASIDLNFVLLGGIFGKQNRIFYIDKEVLTDYRNIQINLDDIRWIMPMNDYIWAK